jgi:hypothetical protein
MGENGGGMAGRLLAAAASKETGRKLSRKIRKGRTAKGAALLWAANMAGVEEKYRK